MASRVEICNLALGFLGDGTTIADFDNDESAQGQACRRFFEPTRLAMLRDFPWNFAKKVVALAVQDEDPTKHWEFSYRLPADYVTALRILSDVRQDTEDTRIPFTVVADNAGGLLYTDEEEAELEYTFNVTNTERFPPDFVLAFAHRMAWLMAPVIAHGDPNKLGPQNYQAYVLALGKAQAKSANEEQLDEPPDAEMIQARD